MNTAAISQYLVLSTRIPSKSHYVQKPPAWHCSDALVSGEWTNWSLAKVVPQGGERHLLTSSVQLVDTAVETTQSAVAAPCLQVCSDWLVL